MSECAPTSEQQLCGDEHCERCGRRVVTELGLWTPSRVICVDCESKPEQFRDAEDMTIGMLTVGLWPDGGGGCIQITETLEAEDGEESVYIGEVSEARALRDWLNKVLP